MEKINRIDFLKNISNNNIKELMCKYFDQNMALYNLIYNNNAVDDVSCEIIENNVSFTIKTSKNLDKEANILGVKNSDIITCYGKNYSIQLNILKNKINLIFIEVVG